MTDLWTPIVPVPRGVASPKLPAHMTAFEYRYPDGELVGYVCRWQTNKGKQVRPLVYCQNGSPENRAWQWQGMPDPRPIFGAELIKPGTSLLIVEGEKKCLAARAALVGTNTVVIAWCGGAQAVKKTDWQPLTGHPVTIWPDADQPGMACANELAEIASGRGCVTSVVQPDPAWPKGHDLDDLIRDGWDQSRILDFMAQRAVLYQSAEARQQARADREDEKLVTKPQPKLTKSAAGQRQGWPFLLLGHDHGSYFYLPKLGQQIIELRAEQHTEGRLCQLAPVSWWARQFPAKSGFDYRQAVSDLIQAQLALGVFDRMRCAGRGAWWDTKTSSAIVHLGEKLIHVKGRELRESPLHDHPGNQIFEYGRELEIDLVNPLGAHESARLAALCRMLNFVEASSAKLLSGWIVCAMVCGALRWKPSIWIQGPYGSGKSTITEKIVGAALGVNKHSFVGGTTEAAIRRALRADAIPVVIDDMDAKGKQQQQTVDNILGLMRVFSGEGTASLAKGATGGGADIFRVHSCYCFSSVAVPLTGGADRSRIAELRVEKAEPDAERLAALNFAISELLTPEFSRRLFGRCVNLIPQIRHNAELMSKLCAIKMKSQRYGDVHGHLIAGHISLMHDRFLDEQTAAQYVTDEGIGDTIGFRALVEKTSAAAIENQDGEACLFHLLEQKFSDIYDGHRREFTVFELIQRAVHGKSNESEHAAWLLKRNGFLLRKRSFEVGDQPAIYIANDHSALRTAMLHSYWPSGWRGVLLSLPGAKPSTGTISYPGRVARAVVIPLSLILDVDKKSAQ